MWVFADFGLLMPASVPALDAKGLTKSDRADLARYTEDGTYDLQVRARVKSHLHRFMNMYMEDGSFNPEIQETPHMDYNFRFYTTRKAFAEGMGRAIAEIDYEKFKPTAERYTDGKRYHDVLNAIWGSVCRLGSPGGIWGARSSSNPKGYGKASTYTRSYRYDGSEYKSIGSSFGERLGDGPLDLDDWDDEQASYWGDRHGSVVEDYTPANAEEVDLLLESLDGIPVDQWDEFLTEREMEVMQGVIEAEKRAHADSELDMLEEESQPVEAVVTRREKKKALRKQQQIRKQAEKHYRRNKNSKKGGRHTVRA